MTPTRAPEAPTGKMASLQPQLLKLIEDVGSILSNEEIEAVVKDTKNYLKSPLYSKIENNDFKSWGVQLQKHGRIGANNLGLLENYVAPKSSHRQEIQTIITEFKSNLPENGLQEEFVGRKNEMEEVLKRLENPRVKALNLFGPPGVGKTTLANEAAKSFCTSKDHDSFKTVKVDLKGSEKSTRNLYFHVLQAFGIKPISNGSEIDWYKFDNQFEVILSNINSLEQNTLVLFDNVEQFLASASEQDSVENFKTLVKTMMEAEKVKLLLTSRQNIDDPSLVDLGLSEFEVEPLQDDLARNMISQSLGTDAEAVSADTLSRIVEVAQNKPLLLKGILPIVKSQIKSLEEVATDIEIKLQEGQSQTPVADLGDKELGAKLKDDSCIKAMFEALTPEQQKETIRLSLFCRSFSVSDAAKFLEKSLNDTNLTLELLRQAQIVSVNDSTDKSVERSYDIHPRLQEYFGSLKNESCYSNDFAKAEELFFSLFVEKMCKMPKLLEKDFVAGYREVQEQKPSFVRTLEKARSHSTPFLLYSYEFYENSLSSIMFEVLFDVSERRDFYHTWSDIAKGKEKWLVSGQLKCWEAEQVLTLEGPEKAMEVLEEAPSLLNRAKPMEAQDSYDAERSLYLYVKGEILEEKNKAEEALELLSQSLKIRKRIFKEHVLTMRTMNEIGNCLQRLERYDEAHHYYYETMQMRRKVTGSDWHSDMPVYYNQLATLHEVNGCAKKLSAQSIKDKCRAKAMYEQADVEFKATVDWYQKALDLEVELGVSGFGNTATYHKNMANTYMHMKDYDKAFEAASKALEIRKNIFKTHPETVKSLYQVGITLEWRAFKKDQDPELLAQALDNYEQASEMLDALPEHNRGPEELLKQIQDRCRELYPQGRMRKGKTKVEAKQNIRFDVSEAVTTRTKSEVEVLLAAATVMPQGQEVELSVEGRTALRSVSVTPGPCAWNVMQAGTYLDFPENAVESTTTLSLFLWSPDKRAPPLLESEALVSSVVEVAPVGPGGGTVFNEPVKLVLSHGAPDNKGYEVVIKQLNGELGFWEDLDTVDIRSSSDIEGDYEKPEDVPDYRFPVAEAEIANCSTFAVVYRLHKYKYEISSKGRTLAPDDFDGISVVFPRLATRTTFNLGLTVQHVPHSLVAEQSTRLYTTPILHFDCPSDLKLTKPVTVRVPLIFEDGAAVPSDIDSQELKVFYRESVKSPDEENCWEDRTGKMELPPELKNGVVELHLKSFSYIWMLVGCASVAIVARVYATITQPKLPATFAVYQNKDWLEQLTFVCLSPIQLNSVQKTMKEDRLERLGFADSRKDMRIEERALVTMDSEPVQTSGGEQLYLMFKGCNVPFRQQVRITCKEKSDVRFLPSSPREDAYCDFPVRLKPVSVREPVAAVEFYGIPFADKILEETPVEQIVYALEPLNLPRRALHELRRLGTDADAEQFFSRIAQLLPKEQEKCFTAIVETLKDLGIGVEHYWKRLQKGKKIVQRPVGQNEIQFVSLRSRVNSGWKELGRALAVKESTLSNIYEEVTEGEFHDRISFERCCQMLHTWLQSEGSAATVRVLMTKLTMCGFGDTVIELAEHLLDSDIDN